MEHPDPGASPFIPSCITCLFAHTSVACRRHVDSGSYAVGSFEREVRAAATLWVRDHGLARRYRKAEYVTPAQQVEGC